MSSQSNYSKDSLWARGREEGVWHNYLFEGFGLTLLVASFVLVFYVREFYALVLFGIMLFFHLRFELVEAPSQVVIEWFGIPVAVWGPGPHFLYPGMSVKKRWLIKSVQQIKIHIDQNDGKYIDGDGCTPIVLDAFGEMDFLDDTAGVEMTLFYRVTSAFRATYNVSDLVLSLIARVESASRAVLSSLGLDDALAVKDGASKLIKSYFLKEGTDQFSHWQTIRNLRVYDRDRGDADGRRIWVTGKDGEFERNRFIAAGQAVLPDNDSEEFILKEWGVAFGAEGVVVADYKLSDPTKESRRVLLVKKRKVEEAAFDRKVAELLGLGQQERITAIMNAGKETGGSLTRQEATAYATALEIVDSGTLRDNMFIVSGADNGLDFTKLAAVLGVTVKTAMQPRSSVADSAESEE